MKTVIISLIAFSLLSGCGQTSKKGSEKAEKAITGNEMHQEAGAPAIELNNGQKWKVNDEMIPHIMKMKNEQAIIGHGSIFNVPVGDGRVIACTFNPLHRYLNHHDSPLLWNVLINWDHLGIR